ncbi:MAG: hypothetical protein V4734_05100, partial [Terriglobus sp.]
AQQDLLHEYAASLWVLDYLCYDATHTELAGMNLHNGPIGSNGYNTFSPIGPAHAYTLSAVGYGMFAFSRGAHGTPIETEVDSNPSQLNFSAYGVQAKDGSIYLYLLNKSWNGNVKDAEVSLPAQQYRHADIMYLKQNDSDPRAAGGITLGGQPVRPDGTWRGRYTIRNRKPEENTFHIALPHLQAAIVHLTR